MEEKDGKPRTVMIAMDGSQHSEYAFKSISMEPRDSLVEGLAQTREEKNKEVYNYIHNLANQHQIPHTVEQLHGHPGLSIVKAAEEKKAGMIICGSRGMGFIRRTVIGSISDYILHHARMPVIICKNEEEQAKMKQWSLF